MISFVAVIAIGMVPSYAAVLTVCPSGCDSTTVQGGIDAASVGDEVRITDSGNYNEELNVNVAGITLTTNSSTPPTVWSSAGGAATPLVDVSVDNVTISGIVFTYNGTRNSVGTIDSSSVSNLTLSNNTIESTGAGRSYAIQMSSTTFSTIDGNILRTTVDRTNYGLYMLSGSSDNTVSNNIITTDGDDSNYGIYLSSSDSNNFTGNSISADSTGGSNHGIYIQDSDGNVFSDDSIDAPDGNDARLVDGLIGDENFFVNVSFNKTDIEGDQVGDLVRLYVQYRLYVLVENQDGAPISGASVYGNDTDSIENFYNPTSNFTGTTNSSGYIGQVTVTEFLANSTNSLGNYLYFTNYTVTASEGGRTNTTSVNATSSLVAAIQLIDNKTFVYDIVGLALDRYTGLPISSGIVRGIVRETGDSNSTSINADGTWRLMLESSEEIEDKTANIGIRVSGSGQTGDVLGSHVLLVRSDEGFTGVFPCTQQTWRFSGIAVDPSSGELSVAGNVQVNIRGEQFSNTTSFSGGVWEIYATPCLVSGDVYTFDLSMSDSSGNTGLITLNHVAK